MYLTEANDNNHNDNKHKYCPFYTQLDLEIKKGKL